MWLIFIIVVALTSDSRPCVSLVGRNLCQWDEAANGGKCVACLLEMRIRRSLAPTTPQPDRPQFLVNNMTQRIGRSLVLGRQVRLPSLRFLIAQAVHMGRVPMDVGSAELHT